MTYALTGASGQLGRLVVPALLDRVDPHEVVLLTRDPDALPGVEDLRARGVDVRRIDFADSATLEPALAGVDRLLLISTDVVGESRVAGHRAAIEAAKAAGVQHIVYTSVPDPVPSNPAGVVPDHAATEDLLAASGLGWTTLRNNMYADMQLSAIEQAAASGQWVTNAGDGATAYVTREDCAVVAAAALAGVDLTGDEAHVVEVSGPAALTPTDLAALAGRVGGREVSVVEVSDEEYAAGLVASGMPQEFADLLTSFGTAARLGHFAIVGPAVQTAKGHPATSVAEVVEAAPVTLG